VFIAHQHNARNGYTPTMIDDGAFWGGTRRVRVGCELTYDLPYAAPLMFVLEPKNRPSQRILDARRAFSPILEPGAFRTYEDAHGNIVWRVLAPAGRFLVHHDLILQVAAGLDPVRPELTGTPVHDLPDNVIVYTLPSRYCPSDLFVQDAWNLFGNAPEGWARVQAVCDWLHANIVYGAGSNASSTALDAYFSRRGVCRDFAHLGVSFCRALNIPARYVCGYLPDIGVPLDGLPMDFHAWFQVFLGGAWRTFDARHNTPRTGRVIIATGRDAADTAFSTTYGMTQLALIHVWADDAGLETQLSANAPRLGSNP
jgi:transglutaminase-like putative cysteine protease